MLSANHGNMDEGLCHQKGCQFIDSVQQGLSGTMPYRYWLLCINAFRLDHRFVETQKIWQLCTQNQQFSLTNHSTNTRPICTCFNTFFHAESKFCNNNLNFKKYGKKMKIYAFPYH